MNEALLEIRSLQQNHRLVVDEYESALNGSIATLNIGPLNKVLKELHHLTRNLIGYNYPQSACLEEVIVDDEQVCFRWVEPGVWGGSDEWDQVWVPVDALLSEEGLEQWKQSVIDKLNKEKEARKQAELNNKEEQIKRLEYELSKLKGEA